MSGGHAGPLGSAEWEAAAAARTVDAPRLAVQKHPHFLLWQPFPCLPT